MPQLLIKPPAWWKADPNQVRKNTDPEEDRRLTESIRQRGILQPPGALADGTGQYGHRRVRCGIAAGLTVMPFYILERPMSEEDARGGQLIDQLTENVQRMALTDAEVYLACKEIMRLNPGWLKQDLAAHLGRNASWVTRALSPDDLIPAGLDAFLGGAFGCSVAYEIGKESEQGQHQLLGARLSSGASRQEIVRQARKVRNGNGQEDKKVSRVKCQVANACVTFAAEGALECYETRVERMARGISPGNN